LIFLNTVQAIARTSFMLALMHLYSITAIVEADGGKDAEAVAEFIMRAICPILAEVDHACLCGWMPMTH